MVLMVAFRTSERLTGNLVPFLFFRSDFLVEISETKSLKGDRIQWLAHRVLGIAGANQGYVSLSSDVYLYFSDQRIIQLK